MWGGRYVRGSAFAAVLADRLSLPQPTHFTPIRKNQNPNFFGSHPTCGCAFAQPPAGPSHRLPKVTVELIRED